MKKRRLLEKLVEQRTSAIHSHGRAQPGLEPEAAAMGELQRGNLPAALEIYNRLLATGSGSADLFNNRGVVYQELQQDREALDSFEQAIACKPDHAEAHNNRGAVLQHLGRHAEALASYNQAIALKPGYANAHHNRGLLLKQMNRPEAALADYDAAIGLNPRLVEAHNNRGALLQEMKHFEAALASFTWAIELNPRHAEAHHNRGIVLVNKGDMREAERMFRRALELKPHTPAAWFSLVNIRQYEQADHVDAQAMLALLAQPGISPGDREYLYFALGKICDDCGQYDEAFGWYRQANEIRNATADYDADRVEKTTTELMEVFDEAFLAAAHEQASATHLPMFIVGMPRSGTTLLANILSQHHSIATAGELVMLPDLISELLDPADNGRPYPQSARELSSGAAWRLTTEYERRLRRDLATEPALVIDKNPLNFRHLGLIARLFPQARVIHCTRHPLDTGVSNYFQRFPARLHYSSDLRNIGHFSRECARLMAHWRRVLPEEPIEISYEELVANTEQTAGRVVAALGLEWDERCLAPHENPNVVDTASQWQVRQPIHQRSVGRWRHYEKHLAPLKEGLGLGHAEAE